jgi:hypothetical protein
VEGNISWREIRSGLLESRRARSGPGARLYAVQQGRMGFIFHHTNSVCKGNIVPPPRPVMQNVGRLNWECFSRIKRDSDVDMLGRYMDRFPSRLPCQYKPHMCATRPTRILEALVWIPVANKSFRQVFHNFLQSLFTFLDNNFKQARPIPLYVKYIIDLSCKVHCGVDVCMVFLSLSGETLGPNLKPCPES